jgi:uncharacterized protein (TIGR00369 family)
MAAFTPRDPDWRSRCTASLARQTFLATLGVRLEALEPGYCTLVLDRRRDLCQQHGFLHAGVTTTLADTAGGYAAYSLMPAGSSVLTTELKINLLNPAAGERLVAVAEVLKPSRTLVVVRADVFGESETGRTLVASMLATMMCLADTPDNG